MSDRPILVALGSNIDPEASFAAAVERLAAVRELSLVRGSRIYRSAPVGSPGSPDFLNAALEVETDLAPEVLKWEVLRRVEAELGRVRTDDRNAPRILDLDLALYGDRTLRAQGSGRDIRLPDPDIDRFVHLARPLADLRPEFSHPALGATLESIASRLEREAPDLLEPIGRLECPPCGPPRG